ncbi:MAG: hypothetical protein DRP73_05370 [Candidatus Omnitrophota bacterium]|nr:MAG: hypothetical protein DRP73_05370 [Candidatus Omnitrophota bacterium]
MIPIFEALMNMGIRDGEMVALVEEKFDACAQRFNGIYVKEMMSQLWLDNNGPYNERVYRQLNATLSNLATYMEMLIRLDRVSSVSEFIEREFSNLEYLARLLNATLNGGLREGQLRCWSLLFNKIMGLFAQIGVICQKVNILSLLKGGVLESESLTGLGSWIVKRIFHYTHTAYPDINRGAVVFLGEMINIAHRIISVGSRHWGTEEKMVRKLFARTYELFLPRYLDILARDDPELRLLASTKMVKMMRWHSHNQEDLRRITYALQSLAFCADSNIRAEAAEWLGELWQPGELGQYVENTLLFLFREDSSSKVRKSAGRGLFHLWVKKFSSISDVNPEVIIFLEERGWGD